MASQGASSTWVLAKKQTAGKGSRGRNWESGNGNFSASLLLRLKETPQNAVLRSFCAALAVADTLTELGVQEAEISLKWPNDVLIQGRKIAGILLESSGQGQTIDQLIVGIGINLTSSPDKSILARGALLTTSLKAVISQDIDPEKTLDILAPMFDRYEMLLSSQGFEPIRKAWLKRAARLNETISVQQGDILQTGVFSDIDLSGALVLTTSKGRQEISAGEIFFPEFI